MILGLKWVGLTLEIYYFILMDPVISRAIHFSVAATDLRNGRLVVASVVGYKNPIGIAPVTASRLLPDQPENRLIRVSTLRTAP